MSKYKLFFYFFIFLIFSCGIDDVVYLYPPVLVHDPTGHFADDQKYISFTTSDTDNNTYSAGYFKGFDIIYKIFESKNDYMNIDNSVKSYIENNSAETINYLLNNHSFSYLRYDGKDISVRPLIEEAAADRLVELRCTAYGSKDAALFINGARIGAVIRKNSKDFSSITSTDEDVKAATTESDKSDTNLYVLFYTAAYGIDKYFKPGYSAAIRLGVLQIEKPSTFR